MSEQEHSTAEAQRLFVELVNEISETGTYKWCVDVVRKSAELARGNEQIREGLKDTLHDLRRLYKDVDRAAPVFEAMYLDGDARPSAKAIGERFYIDKRTVFRRVNTVLGAIAIYYFKFLAVPLLSLVKDE